MRKEKTRAIRIYQKITQRMTSVHLAGIAVAIYIISLLPILALSFYAHPSADDFNYGVKTHFAVISGQGLGGVLQAAWETVCENYMGWQGTFSAIFFFSLQPGVFSESAYFFTTFIMLGTLSISTVLLMLALYKHVFHGKRSHAVIVSMVLLFLQIQTVYNDTEAFYWFNGASYYTLFYSFSLLLAAALISLICSRKIKYMPACIVLAVLVGGGNYSTALCTSVAVALFVFFLWKQHHPSRKQVAVICVCLLIAFSVSVAAPGNAVRASSIAQSYSPVVAIVQSLLQAAQCIRNWCQLPQVIFVLIAAAAIGQFPCESKGSFSYPFIFSIVSFVTFATQFTPPLYAMANIGADRQIDIYYYSCYWLLFIQLYYWIGWYKTSRKTQILSAKTIANGTKMKLVILGIVGLCFSLMDVTRIHISQIDLSSARALCALVNGSASDYKKAYEKRIALLTTPSQICYLPSIPDCPPLRSDLVDTDPTYWVNYGMAQYYQHMQVIKADTEGK